jgi:hydroxyethylthiazole kinase
MKEILARIKKNRPLIHHITNNVTVNDCANITYYWGGLPVMAHNPQEVEEMVGSANALVLNIGALDFEPVETLIKAGREANRLGIPVILDPVGAGATLFRTELSLRVMNEVKLAVIKGNAGEITVLSGSKAEMRGVEAMGTYSDLGKSARGLARREEAIVVVSGVEDLVTDGKDIYYVKNGHPLLGQVVGTGCMLGSTIAVFCSVESDYLQATLTATAAYSIAGEKAGEEVKGPASFKIKFLDAVSFLNDKEVSINKKIERIR